MNHPWTAHYPAGIPAEINPDTFASIPALFDEVAKTHGNHTAFVCLRKSISYKEVNTLSTRFAGYLQSLGLEPGDRVAVMMPNLTQYMIALLGILRAGLIAVNVNPLYTAHELAHQLKDSGAKAVVIIENFAKTLETALPETKVKHIITTKVGDMLPWHQRLLTDFVIRYVKKMVPEFSLPNCVNFRDALAIGKHHGFAPVALKNTDIALLQYTGGTTGVAKGAMLTHRNVLANVVQTALPLYHIFSFTATLCFAKKAATQVLVPNARDIPGLAALMDQWNFTIISGVNTLFNALINNKQFQAHKFGHLKMTVGGGTQVQKAVAEKWAKVTGCPILEAYGLTETSPGVCGNLPGAPWDGSVGYPIPSTEVTIRSDDFKDLGLCSDPEKIPDYTGEICVKGPQVMLGYWEKPEETANVLVDGWLKTGDVGYMGAEGKITKTSLPPCPAFSNAA